MAYIGGLNQDGVRSWNGVSEALPPAEGYEFEVEEVEQEPSSQKGTLMLNAKCRVISGEMEGRTTTHRLVCDPNKPKALGRLVHFASACGVFVDDQGGFDDQELIGKRFRADCINEPYTKTDSTTGQTVERMQARLQNEQPIDGDGAQGYPAGGQQQQARQPQGQQPRGAAPQGGRPAGGGGGAGYKSPPQGGAPAARGASRPNNQAGQQR